MIEYKYPKEHYIYNKNRNAMKKWLLNPPTKYHELLLDMAGFVPFDNKYSFDFCFDNCYEEEEEAMCVDCCKDLGIDYDDNCCDFSYLLYALSKWLTPSDRLKKYKIHLKKIELNKDFTTL